MNKISHGLVLCIVLSMCLGNLQAQNVTSAREFSHPHKAFPKTLVQNLRSQNGSGKLGQRYFDLGSNFPNSTDTSPPFKHRFVYDIEVSPDFDVDRTVMALVSGSNEVIYKSTNTGAVWQPTTELLPGKKISDMALAPDFADSRTVIASISANDPNDYGFVMVSEDGGNNWEAIAESQFLSGAKVAFSPTFSADSTIFVAHGKALYRIKNKLYAILALVGPVASFPANINQIIFSPNFENDSTMFVCTDSNTGGGGLFRSQDSGSTWEQITRSLITSFTPPVGESFEVMAVSPAFSADSTIFVTLNEFFRGTIAFWRSHNAGATWDSLYSVATGLTVRGISSMAISPDFSNDQNLFVGTAVGAQKTTNQGELWQFTNQGLNNLVIQSLAISPDFANDRVLFAGTHNGIFKSTDGGVTWASSSEGLPKSSLVNVSDNPFFLDTIPSVAVDSSGTVHVVWWGTHFDPNSPDGVSTDVTYTRKVEGIFEEPIIIPVATGFYSKDITLTIEPNGKVHIAFRRASDQVTTGLGDDLFYVSGRDGIFDAPTMAVDGNISDEWAGGPNRPSIAVDHIGNVHIAYVELSGDLWYTNNNTGEFREPVMVVQEAAKPDLKSDDFGNLHLVYILQNSGAVEYLQRRSDEFTAPISVGSNVSTLSQVSLAIERSGIVHIAYGGSNRWINYVSGKDSTFSEPIVLERFGAQDDPALVVDQLGNVHIAFVFNNGTIKFFTNKSGQFESVLVSSGRLMTVRGLALGPDNLLHMVTHSFANTIFSEIDHDIFYAEFAANTAASHLAFGSIFNLVGSIPGDVDITFNAYIVSRPNETLTETSAGSGYKSGKWFVQCAQFPTVWQPGDTLRVEFVNSLNGETGVSEGILSAGGSDNFDDLVLPVETIKNIPLSFELNQNYPNPFNPETRINYQIPKATHVELTIFNLLGQNVVTIVNDIKLPGTYSVTWNGNNSAGKSVSSGIYLYKLKTREFTKVRKLTLLR